MTEDEARLIAKRLYMAGLKAIRLIDLAEKTNQCDYGIYADLRDALESYRVLVKEEAK